MKRSALAPSTTPMKRTPMPPRQVPLQNHGMGAKALVQDKAPTEAPAVKPRKKSLRTRQRAVTVAEKLYWDRLATIVGCIACRHDGHVNPVVSIHHIDGRTKAGCHQLVLPLCAGHHQQGTGPDPTLIARHPTKALFVQRYGSELELKAQCDALLAGEGA